MKKKKKRLWGPQSCGDQFKRHVKFAKWSQNSVFHYHYKKERKKKKALGLGRERRKIKKIKVWVSNQTEIIQVSVAHVRSRVRLTVSIGFDAFLARVWDPLFSLFFLWLFVCIICTVQIEHHVRANQEREREGLDFRASFLS